MIWLMFCTLALQMIPESESEPDTTDNTGTVIVEAVGFQSDEGQAVICLFPEREWSMPPNPDNATVTVIEEIKDLAAYTEIDSLYPSDYGVLVFQDLNCDNELDSEDEPWGIYGEIPAMGPPSGSQPSGAAPSGGPPAGGPVSRSGIFLEIDGSVGIARIVVRKHEDSPGFEGAPPGGPPNGGGGPPMGGGMP